MKRASRAVRPPGRLYERPCPCYLLNGAAQRSYRQTVMGLNRRQHQLEGGTPLNTLRDGAEAERAAVLSFLERERQQVFEQHGFSAAGEPSAGCQTVQQAEAYQPQVQEARTVRLCQQISTSSLCGVG